MTVCCDSDGCPVHLEFSAAAAVAFDFGGQSDRREGESREERGEKAVEDVDIIV